MYNAISPASYAQANLTTLILAHKMRGWEFQCDGDDKSVQFTEGEQAFTGRPPLVIDESELPY